MWISTNETASSKMPGTTTKTPHSGLHTPHFSDEDNHPASQPSVKPQSTENAPKPAIRSASSSKKAIKTYTTPVHPSVSSNQKRTNSVLTPKNPPVQRRIKIGLCALLYAAGTLASGFLFTALSPQEREVLRYFSQQQLSIGSTQPFERFLVLFLPALLQIALILIFSFCAIGAPLIGILIALSGVASGASAMVWISGHGTSGVLMYIITIGLYLAILTAIVCSLGQQGINLSYGLFSATFSPASHHSSEHNRHSHNRFLRTSLCCIIGLVAICGILAAASDLCQGIINSLI